MIKTMPRIAAAAAVLSAALLATNPTQAMPLGAAANIPLASETTSSVTQVWGHGGFHRGFFFHRPFFHRRAFFFHRPFFHRRFAFCRWC